jgi:hypothetical protein
MSRPAARPRVVALCLLLTATAFLLAQCRSSGGHGGELSASAALAGWDAVYDVLQHPRCVNCHPAGDAPLQGERSLPHAQNVRRGPEGRGVFALGCADCHQTQNVPGANVPPGAPHWQLPHPDQPLVFEGLSSGELCRNLRDPGRNGGRTPEQVLDHVAADPLVLWGWDPGEGRRPVPVPHAALVRAMRAWVDGGCACPE